MAKKKQQSRINRHTRIRKRVFGSVERPRLAVYRSSNHFHAQIIDDTTMKTLMGVSTLSKDFSSSKDSGNIKGARELGKLVAKKALEKKIQTVVFDRGGFFYHGRIKAFAEGAREGGLTF